MSVPRILRRRSETFQLALIRAGQALGMTLTTLITLNAVIGAALFYGLHLLLAYGIRSDRPHHEIHRHQAAKQTSTQERERIAA